MFKRVKSGQFAGELVRLRYGIGSPSVIERHPPVSGVHQTGYGSKVPTRFMVRTINNTWRRVYAARYGNTCTMYVMHGKEKTIIEIVGPM